MYSLRVWPDASCSCRTRLCRLMGICAQRLRFFLRHGDSPFLDGKASISKDIKSYTQKPTKKL